MIGVAQQFEKIERPAYDADAVSGGAGIARQRRFHVTKLGFYFEPMVDAGHPLVKPKRPPEEDDNQYRILLARVESRRAPMGEAHG